MLAERIGSEVKLSNENIAGDWSPLIFIFSDGCATDNLQNGIDALKKVKTGIVVACAAGQGAKIDELEKITKSVVTLDNADSSSISAFFQWVSASISVNSKAVDSVQDNEISISDLPPPPPEINVVDLTKR